MNNLMIEVYFFLPINSLSPTIKATIFRSPIFAEELSFKPLPAQTQNTI